MEKRQQMALAAVGAVVALIYLMRKQPQAAGGLPAAVSSAASGSTKPAPIIVTVGSTKPQAVADAGPVANPAPAPAPAPQPVGVGGFVVGGGLAGAPAPAPAAQPTQEQLQREVAPGLTYEEYRNRTALPW